MVDDQISNCYHLKRDVLYINNEVSSLIMDMQSIDFMDDKWVLPTYKSHVSYGPRKISGHKLSSVLTKQNREKAVIVIQRQFRESITNPVFVICKKRLRYEFQNLDFGIMIFSMYYASK
jgi:hypothetical protein